MSNKRSLNTQPMLLISFDTEDALLAGVGRLRGAGHRVLDVFTPYPVHGLSEALSLPPSRLPIATFLCGLTGALSIWWLQHWASAIDWPINVGGKPWDSLPAFFPAIFELMVLFAGYGSVLTLFIICGLWFGRHPKRIYAGATSNRFVAVVPAAATLIGEADVRALLSDCLPFSVTESCDCGQENRR